MINPCILPWKFILPLSFSTLLLASCSLSKTVQIVPAKNYPLYSLTPDRLTDSPLSTYHYNLKRTKSWSLTREHLTDRITLSHNLPNSLCKQVDLPKSIYPLSLHEQANGTTWLVSYNILASSPSGKRPGLTSNLIDIYYFKPNACQLAANKMITIPDLSDIDTTLYTASQASSLHLCAKNACYTVSSDGKTIKWNTSKLSDFEFVEVVFGQDKAFALLRKKRNNYSDEYLTSDLSHFYLSTITQSESATPTTLNLKGIPYALQILNNQPAISVANTPSQLFNVYTFDLSRQGPFGLRAFSQNNLEGRVAWSQVYYLKSLINLQDPRIYNLFEHPYYAKLASYLEDEIKSILTLCTSANPDNPFFVSRRYSLDRAPLLFALHLGRIVDLLHRYKSLGGSQNVSHCLSRVTPIISNLSETVEYLPSASILKKELHYKKSAKFWADGANVPYNYTSGISLALSLNANTKSLSQLLMSHLFNTEFASGFPKVWRYWSGIGDHGWKPSESISFNTPSFLGNNGAIAHITYRNIDASALLATSSPQTILLLSKHFLELVRTGLLLPSLFESLDAPLTSTSLSPDTAKYYSRSTNVWELESQPWALSVLSHMY